MNTDVLKNKLFAMAFSGLLFHENSKKRANYNNVTLPFDWQLKKLSDLGTITSSKRVFQKDWKKSGIPFYRARDIVALNKGKKVSDVFISKDMYDEYSKKYGIPKENDILITGVGTIGETYIVKKEDKFYFKDGNIIWFKNNGMISAEYLKLFFESPIFLNQIYYTAKGSTVLTFTITHANEVLVPLPPIEIQKRIVSKMGDIKELLFKLEKNEEILLKYKKIMTKKIISYVINELFLNKIAQDDKIIYKNLGELLLYEQPTKYIVNTENYNAVNGVPVLTAGKTFILGYTSEKQGIFDKVPVIIFDDFTTDSRYIDFPFKVKSSAIKILKCNDKMNIKYFYYLMQSINFNASTHKRYWISEYSKIIVPIPSLGNQNKIVQKIDELLDLINQI